jgi:hypothetical protein
VFRCEVKKRSTITGGENISAIGCQKQKVRRVHLQRFKEKEGISSEMWIRVPQMPDANAQPQNGMQHVKARISKSLYTTTQVN